MATCHCGALEDAAGCPAECVMRKLAAGDVGDARAAMRDMLDDFLTDPLAADFDTLFRSLHQYRNAAEALAAAESAAS